MPPALSRLLLALAILATALPSQDPAPNLVIPSATPLLDGHLTEWTQPPALVLAKKEQVVRGSWSGDADLAACLWLAADSSHLYVAGWVQDDEMTLEAPLDRLDRVDALELHFGFGASAELGVRQADENPLVLMPLHPTRNWMWLDPARASAQAGASLSGLRVVGKRTSPTRFEFEAAIPFHHFVSLRPGQRRCGVNVVLRDQDGKDDETTVMSWTGRDPAQQKSLAPAELPAPGPLVPAAVPSSQWAGELFADLPYLLVPLATLAGLVFLLRGWSSVRDRARWLRPLLVGGGVLLFVVGLAWPSLAERWRSAAQHERIADAHGRLQAMLGKLEVLGSYRGPSRDHALMDLLRGRAIPSQRYTSYRSLAQLAPGQFGPPLRNFDDLPVRDYWLPLTAARPERFQFDPPLRGRNLHVVVGRQFVPSFPFAGPKLGPPPRLELELDFGDGAPRRVPVDLLRSFQDAQPLGRESWEAMATPVPLPAGSDLRAVTVASVQGEDLHLVGMSLEGQTAGQIEPLWLGEATRQGVLTDLRGPFPLDAGLELASGATASVPVPKLAEPPQRLWFVYRAIYPRFASAVPGARVGEIVLHFAGGKKSTLQLEHQVSVFYELAVHNTRDDLPEGSPASIALSWVDDKQERRVNLGYPVVDLPADTPLESIEFRNHAGYRMQFRSVVFVNERSSAPQNPPDSPLVRSNNSEWHLRDSARSGLDAALLAIYRGGRLGESNRTDGGQPLPMVLPRAVAAAEGGSCDELLADGSRRALRAEPLGGDGWDGAVLAVGDVDREWSLAMQFANRLGLALCLLSAPFLLVLLSELLAAATNLRFRLMAVTTVAALAPLGLLSLVLVQVLEGGHAAEVEQGLRQSVRSATAQLGEQKAKLRSSAQQWLADLGADVATRLRGVDEAKFAAAVPGVAADLQKLLAGQLPPDWRSGFLRLEWSPRLGKVAPAAVVLVAGDVGRASGELPTRADPGVFLQWGAVMLGVRAEQSVVGGSLALVAARPIDGDLLGTIAPGLDVLLTDVRGYPVAVAGSRLDRGALFQRATEPARMLQREQALQRALESQEPVVAAGAGGDADQVDGSDVLRDLQGTPRALLTVVRPAQRATLDLAVGRVPVRAFFLLVAGSLIVLSVFLSYVVSGRISRPIEKLELGAQALSRGQFDTRVPEVDGGQIGRLTRAFNRMASDLHARLLDLQTLNRTMCELAAGEDEAMTIGVLLRFCQTQTAADDVRVVLVDPSGPHLRVHSSDDGEVHELAADSLPLPQLAGAFACAPANGSLPGAWSPILPRSRSLIALPIVFGGQARGVVVLGFACAPPLPVDLGLLGTVVAQAAVAFERGLLQRLAVHDPVTGMVTPEYFRRRVADEVSLAQQRNHPLAMLALVLGDGDRRPRGVRRFGDVLRRVLPGNAVLSHAGAGHFQACLPGVPRELALSLLQQVQQQWATLVLQRPDGEAGPAPRAVAVQFPDEAASAEFLFDALRARLVESGASGDVESDEALLRAGVTAMSPVMREVYRTLRRVAPTDLPILLEGETGVGKEVLTNLVHRWSRRANGPLIKVHCAALSESLLASELFGHEKGAFTGADRRKLGRFEQADGGTLFLDEVGEISLDVQVKLLRVLQEGEVERVGGTAPVRVDVRVLAATNRDIARMVAAGTFRQDLYYRLQGMVVHVPALRERKPELAPLVEQFRLELAAGGDVPLRSWSTDAMDELYRQEWPGNIRQLRNTVFRAMVLAHGSDVQRRDVLAAMAVGTVAVPASTGSGGESASVLPVGSGDAIVPTVGSASSPGAGSPPASLAAPTPHPAVEPMVEIPRTAAAQPEVAKDEADPVPMGGAPAGLASLSPRLLALLRQVVAAGTYSTQNHMVASGLSHRTALRDMQALLAAGALERVGSRRGAFYRPSEASDRFLQGLAKSAGGPSPVPGEVGENKS